MKYTGRGQRRILIVGEAPGAEEDERNEQFVGRAGQRLQAELRREHLDLFRDCWKTNAIRCRPPENKKPTHKMVSACRPALFAEILQLQPEAILLFGGVAAEAVLGQWWGPDRWELGTWTGWIIPHRQPNCWVSVHYHPSYLERQKDSLLDLLFRQQLQQAFRKSATGRPWTGSLPDEQSDVEILYAVPDIVKRLRSLHGRALALDYETNCLKPEYPKAQIVSCSVSTGRETLAFPWLPVLRPTLRPLLQGPIRKIASNAKFEERWTRYHLGYSVQPWFWDTMLAAHVQNQAKGVTGLKFQAFVRLGLPKYDVLIEPRLRPRRGAYLNQIREIPLPELLLYNGTDSRVTYEIAQQQFQEMYSHDGSHRR